MGDRIDDLSERVQALEAKMDQMPASIDRRFDAVDAAIDRRFDAVDAAIREQREYTEFAFDRVKAEVRAAVASGVGRLERKLDQFIDRHLPPLRQDPPEQPK